MIGRYLSTIFGACAWATVLVMVYGASSNAFAGNIAEVFNILRVFSFIFTAFIMTHYAFLWAEVRIEEIATAAKA